MNWAFISHKSGLGTFGILITLASYVVFPVLLPRATIAASDFPFHLSHS